MNYKTVNSNCSFSELIFNTRIRFSMSKQDTPMITLSSKGSTWPNKRKRGGRAIGRKEYTIF